MVLASSSLSLCVDLDERRSDSAIVEMSERQSSLRTRRVCGSLRLCAYSLVELPLSS